MLGTWKSRLYDSWNEFLIAYLLVGFLIFWLPLALLISTNYYLADEAKHYVTVPVIAQRTDTNKLGKSFGWVEVEWNGYMKRITFSYWRTLRDRRIDRARFVMSRGY
ncbi:hypothetical protein BW716_28790 [[Flexibacter] sp. ATCC 35208]|nr:hypothetical protein BW716_28790 [[Flexibacter] sp. ATCC 35208]